jgi:hypothetical protein
MAFSVMAVVENSRAPAPLVAHLPSLAMPSTNFFRSFLTDYEAGPILLTTEARRKFTLHRVNMTDILPSCVEAHYEVAASLAKDNYPTIRVVKECGLHKQMLFSTPVMIKSSKQIIGVLLAYDEVPDNLCPSPGHLLPATERKTGFLTSLFHKSDAKANLKRLWSLNAPPRSPNPSEKSVEYAMAVV